MKLIVGLGNPGEKYEKTRHNSGFMVVDQFLRDFEPVLKTSWKTVDTVKSDVVEIEWKPKHGELEKIILAKPLTYMNNAGFGVKLLLDFFEVSLDDVWIVHDDIDLRLGGLRIRLGGSAGGHHGVESIMHHLGTEKFWRFRLGIGHPGSGRDGEHKGMVRHVEDFVLSPFTQQERGKVKDLIKHAAKAIAYALEHDLESAMNKFNTK